MKLRCLKPHVIECQYFPGQYKSINLPREQLTKQYQSIINRSARSRRQHSMQDLGTTYLGRDI